MSVELIQGIVVDSTYSDDQGIYRFYEISPGLCNVVGTVNVEGVIYSGEESVLVAPPGPFEVDLLLERD